MIFSQHRLFMTVFLVVIISYYAFEIQACISPPSVQTTADTVQNDAVLDPEAATTSKILSPMQLNQGVELANTTILNNTFAATDFNTIIPTRKLIAATNPNITFEEWKVDAKLEKLLGIERPLVPVHVKKSAKAKHQHEFKDISLPFSNPSWKLRIAPAVSWTYCYPACGSGDQAIDAENAFENAHADVLSAINVALSILNLAPLNEHNIRLSYTPPNTLLEEFGNYTDKNDTKYRVKDSTVRYFIHKQGNTTVVDDYLIKASISITSNYILSASLWEKVSTTLFTFLRKERHIYFYSPLKMTSYKSSNVSFSLLI